MCGIVGQIRKDRAVNEAVFKRMRDRIAHRGPDGQGTQLLHEGYVALGHRRLSIIDLSDAGLQPMCNEDETIWLTFNGEIYNFKTLRGLLEKTHTFKSNTDSEVLIHGYEEWGIKGLLSRLKGMFAFAIWDKNKEELYAARDRFGIKPFVYYHDKNQFSFASEIKSFLEDDSIQLTLDHDSLADFFIYSYVPQPNSIWKNVKKLPPASYLIYNKNSSSITLEKYWNLKIGAKSVGANEAISKTKTLLHQSVRDHLVSDVPVGHFLSGGYDSSTLLKYMTDEQQQINTFSIGFEKSENSEHSQAAFIAEYYGSTHHLEMLSPDTNNLETLKYLSKFYDEPYAISSLINYYYISKLTAKDHKVALAGDGGDEAFAGYRWHYGVYERYGKNTLRNKVKFLLKGKKNVLLEHYNKSMPGIGEEIKDLKILNPNLVSTIKKRSLWYFEKNYSKSDSAVKQFQYLDTHTFMLDACLHRADISSMANSLEVRVPFLDHEIFEYLFSLDSSVYFKPGTKKFLLYEILKNDLPNSILDMPKRGFGFQHLYTFFNDDYINLLKGGELEKNGILKKGIKLENLENRIKFHLIILELWFREHHKQTV